MSELKNNKLVYYAQSSLETVINDLQTSKDGLQASDYESRHQERMNFDRLSHDSWFLHFRRAFINPFSVVLLVMDIIAFFVDIVFVEASNRNYMSCLMMTIMFCVSGLIRYIQEMKAKKISDELITLIDHHVQVKRDGSWQLIDPSQLVKGDLVRVKTGETVPADLRLVVVDDCFISEAVITGESEVQEKSMESLQGHIQRLSDYKNIAFCGTSVISGLCEGFVVGLGKESVYGEISPDIVQRKSGFDRGANSIAWVLIRFMVILVPMVFITSGLVHHQWMVSFLFALSVAVGLTPEMLPMVITACLAKGSYSMNQKQTLVKNINAMQEFGHMDVLCVDKTGTLTVESLLLEYYMDILGNENQQVLDDAYLNSYFQAGMKNPLDKAILNIKTKHNQSYYSKLEKQYEKLDEIPFDSDRKLASVLIKKEKPCLIVKGSIAEVFERCDYVQYKDDVTKISQEMISSVHAVVDDMLDDGMKVLAIAIKNIDQERITKEDEYQLTLLGYIAFFNAPKPSAMSAIQKLQSLNVHIKVLTGDHLSVAHSICLRLGMDTTHTLTGHQLENLDENDWPLYIEKTTIFAELSPTQKQAIVAMLQDNGHSVGFLGDGMNDLPAVLSADVGISVDSASSALKESADVVLLKKDLNVLESGILEGRKAFANMSKYVKITASSNLGNMISIVIASLFLPFFPMTSMQILLLNLLYDIICLVLPWDCVDDDICHQSLEWSGKNLSQFMLFFGPVSSIFDVMTFVVLYFVICPLICGGQYLSLLPENQMLFVSLFQTGWFLESMWTQILILYLLRTNYLSFIKHHPSQPVLYVSLLGIVGYTFLTMSPIGDMIGMTQMPALYFLFLIVIILCYFLIITFVKKIYLRRYQKLI